MQYKRPYVFPRIYSDSSEALAQSELQRMHRESCVSERLARMQVLSLLALLVLSLLALLVS